MRPYIARLNGDRLGGVMTCLDAPTIPKIVHRLYNGQPMVQTVGRASVTAGLTVEATSAEMQLLNQAAIDCELVELYYNGATRYGYIEGFVRWSPVVPGAVYEGTLELMIAEVST